MSVGKCRLCGRTSKHLDADGFCPNEREELAEAEERKIAFERALAEAEGEEDAWDKADKAYAELKDK